VEAVVVELAKVLPIRSTIPELIVSANYSQFLEENCIPLLRIIDEFIER